MAFGKDEAYQIAIESLQEQIRTLQDEKADLMDRLMASYDPEAHQRFSIGRVDENFIPPKRSSLYTENDPEEAMIGQVIDASKQEEG